MRKKVGTLLVTLILLLVIVIPVAAITNGEPDNGRHPFVGLMVADDDKGEPLWRCSGTLISPSVFLTAGHCTEAPAVRATIWFAEDVEATPDFGTPDGYPYEGDVDGTVYTHPQYDPYAFYLYDLGVVVLDEPITDRGYAELPDLGVLDDIKGKEKKGALTAVGYGLQEINPNRYTGERDRLLATLDLINTKGVFGVPRGTAIKVSGSGVGGDNSDSGGTCFGDSGGPQFLADTHIIAAVTSFGLNGNCAGVGGGYRVDQPDDLEWLAEVLTW
ncbi:MAG: trypsin-like serine protease [Anaerolineales bacterium]|jgi:hypothetical protein